MNRLAWALLASCLLTQAANTVQLSQIQSKSYLGVMVNTGRGWVQALIGTSMRVNTATNPPTLEANGVAGPQGPPGPAGAQGTEGVQGIQGIPGPAGPAAPSLPITVDPDGSVHIHTSVIIDGQVTSGNGPTSITVTKGDGTSCTITFTGGPVVCQ